MKKNGTTTKGTTRWRCTNRTCGASTTDYTKLLATIQRCTVHPQRRIRRLTASRPRTKADKAPLQRLPK
ncbi:hypothetical protein FE376_02540 [Corynebacterium diphtheriae]|nr:hypothetical protein B1A63_02915 [Corynebacterium diphtheriae]OSQ03322.1 hypothetical protein B1A65_02005 [Corynebacterium diphtheriae]OSQ03646.1 hypothetical protein B1A62_01160 [Corynebacterium diphtheriae]OSQ10327.1 hypothetical protein B1A60_02915 [Corynebacterium diphtheriae]OSQ13211.1 hypothetical protein B1A58_02950 [Corynebacterium diphtheriae]